MVCSAPPEFERACEDEYRRARWPGGAPSGFPQRAAAARIFVRLRWLGEHPSWTENEDTGEQLSELQRLTRSLIEP